MNSTDEFSVTNVSDLDQKDVKWRTVHALEAACLFRQERYLWLPDIYKKFAWKTKKIYFFTTMKDIQQKYKILGLKFWKDFSKYFFTGVKYNVNLNKPHFTSCNAVERDVRFF